MSDSLNLQKQLNESDAHTVPGFSAFSEFCLVCLLLPEVHLKEVFQKASRVTSTYSRSQICLVTTFNPETMGRRREESCSF